MDKKAQQEEKEKRKQRKILMARRKHEAALQVEIETQEEWEEMLGKEGLTMVDVYADWCGPCKALTAILRRVKNELGDDLLRFAIAKTDTIDSLENYRNKSQPCFLFYAGGALVAYIRGANCPLVIRTIHEQLAAEHKVLDGSTERKEVYDLIAGGGPPEKDQVSAAATSVEEEEKQVTLAIIKPDAVRNGKVEEILEQLEVAGIEVVHQEERCLTEEEAREFYSHIAEESYFEDYIAFMTSGPSYVLVLTQGEKGENVIANFRDLLGPPSVETAKEEAPDSLRAQYGEEDFRNAIHGSSDPDAAVREMAFFFPAFQPPTVTTRKSKKKPKLQRTLALIRPDALLMHKDEIISKITEAGFEIALEKQVQLTKDQAIEFYKEHEGQPYFDELVERMCSGPLLALGLAREDAVDKWRDVLGPKEIDVALEQAPDSMRAQFSDAESTINALHGSSSLGQAQEELEYFFPKQKTIAVIKPDGMGTKEKIISKIHEAGFKIAARKETMLTREMAEQLYSDQKDKEYFDQLVEYMTTGQTYFMVLSREDAVQGWRDILGPTDPSVAKEENPDTLRAIYGTDIQHNAVHGASNEAEADNVIEQFFGEIDLDRADTASMISQDRTRTGSTRGATISRSPAPDKTASSRPASARASQETIPPPDAAADFASADDGQSVGTAKSPSAKSPTAKSPTGDETRTKSATPQPDRTKSATPQPDRTKSATPDRTKSASPNKEKTPTGSVRSPSPSQGNKSENAVSPAPTEGATVASPVSMDEAENKSENAVSPAPTLPTEGTAGEPVEAISMKSPTPTPTEGAVKSPAPADEEPAPPADDKPATPQPDEAKSPVPTEGAKSPDAKTPDPEAKSATEEPEATVTGGGDEATPEAAAETTEDKPAE